MEKETKEQRFRRVAEKRVQNILKSMRSLSQLANGKVYKWDNGQLKKIWEAIDKEYEFCRKAFDDPDSDVFRL